MKALRTLWAFLFLLTGILFAGEGMWTFDNPPKKLLKEKYGFEVTQDWLDHVRMASVRFNDGGSGSFVSPNGLVMTNHHVGLGQLQKMSKEGNDYVANGFYARTNAEEVKCVDLELNVLMAMQDVTPKVADAIKFKSGQEAAVARRAVLAQLQKEIGEKTGMRADLVTLYNGAEYWIYSYKKFTDIRLVMAPEQQIAFFGGDPDNFTFPRYDLDMCFFRVYENGKPYNPPHYLKWKTAGAADGELVFTSGHPGSTARQQTMAQIEYLRDYQIPYQLKNFKRRLEALKAYSARGEEQSRRALSLIFGLENSQKAIGGQYAGLLDKNLMAKKQSDEQQLRERVNANPELKAQYAWAWDTIAAAMARNKTMFNELTYRGVTGSLAPRALTIARYATEMKKPNGERLPQYQDANLKVTLENLYSPAPIYLDFEQVQLEDRFSEALEVLGANDPWVKAVLDGRTPQAAAELLITTTRISDVAFRKALIEAGSDEILKSNDPMIKMALRIAPIGDEMRAWQEKNVNAALASAVEATGKARFAVYGKELPPDANFTLRLSYGEVKGFPMNGTKAPSLTTMYGLYDRAYSFQNQKDFELPKRFQDGVGKLNLTTPMNFVSTNDIIGGNSGSPVINAKAEVVGLIFDGNIESLPGRFAYSEEKNRAVSVHPGVMIETMRKLYDANILADELEGILTKPEPKKESPVKATKPAAKKKKR
ncbi:MAG: S46 family peptidase [Bacteroidetes bacterium]|nr:S46 family peptidase [Bacteroidota bacterium]